VVGSFAHLFTYKFAADADGVLDFTLQSFFSGRELDVGNWVFGAVDLSHPEHNVVDQTFGYNGGNSLQISDSLSLQAGDTYELVLRAFGSTFDNGQVPGFSDAHESGVFNWSITSESAAVPEPEAWALMLLGLGSTGAMLRAHRRRTATA
jgi:hypothetical protein